MEERKSYIALRLVLILNALGYLGCSLILYVMPRKVVEELLSFFVPGDIFFNAIGFYCWRAALILCMVLGVASIAAALNPVKRKSVVNMLILANALVALNCVITGFTPTWYKEINSLVLLYDLVPSGLMAFLIFVLRPRE